MSNDIESQIAALPPDLVEAIERRAIERFVAEVEREQPTTMAGVLSHLAELLKPGANSNGPENEPERHETGLDVQSHQPAPQSFLALNDSLN